MSDLRFIDELGAEFERLEQAGALRSRPRRSRSWSARLTGRVVMAAAVAVPVAIAVLAIALVSPRVAGRHTGTGAASGNGLALAGGNCRTPAPTGPVIRAVRPAGATDQLIRAGGGLVSGIPWELRVQPDRELPGSLEHGRLELGGRQYGLCSRRSVPVPFGLIDTGPHGTVYGYVTGGTSYRIAVSAGATPITTSVTNTFFFIVTLPRPACSYQSLSVTATATPVAGLPPAISRSLDDDAPRFTTTMRFGACRPNALVTPVSEHGQSRGRSPNAPLARAIAQLNLVAASRSHRPANGIVWELTHDGHLGINVLAVGLGLSPGRYGIWLLGPHNRATALGAVTVTGHELRGAFDLPPGAGSARQIVVAAQPSSRTDRPGTIVLRAAPR